MRGTAALSLVALLVTTRAALAQGGTAGDFVTFETVAYRDRVEKDGSAERVQDVRVLLRDAAAVAAFGQIAVPYVDGNDEVAFENVAIEKADGRQIAVKDARTEEINPFGITGSSIAADVRLRKLTVPGLEPGDHLSYRAVIRQKPLVPGRIFGEMKFSGMTSDPLQVYELDLPRGAPITVELGKDLGASWQPVDAPADRLVRRLSVRPKRPDFGNDGPTEADLEALKQPDVVFTNFRSWAEVGEWWWALARDRLAPDAAVRAEAMQLVKGKSSAQEKLEALHAFVASRIRYLNVNFGLGRMQPRRAAEVLSNKYGDCKDKVTLLAALGAAAGIDVRPVLVHSARKTLRDDAPGPQQFDHMIAVAELGPTPKEWLWLDATNDLGLPGYLLPGLRDKPALMIDEAGKGRIVRTPEAAPFRQRVEVDVKGALQPEGRLKAHVRWTFRSDSEVQMRYGVRLMPQDRRAEAVKTGLARAWKDAKISNVATTDPSELKDPFRIEFDVERTPSDQSAEKEWALWLPLPEIDLPVPRKDAGPGTEQAVQFRLDEFVVTAEVQLPEGFSGRAPLSIALNRPFGRYQSDYAVEGTRLKATRRLELLRRSVPGTDLASYEAFRQAVEKDRVQDFWVEPGRGTTPASVSAEALHGDGVAALDKEEYDKAIGLLQRAVAADPKVKDGFEDLGRALRDAGRPQEALEAFKKQIELEPFHEYAYAERAYVLLDLDRKDEAEKDLLKEIEVAPFKAWSYERLGQLRVRQQRYDEAARYYVSATSIETKKAEDWERLGWAHALAGHPAEAGSAFERARGLEPADWMAVRIAAGFSFIGNAAVGSEIAEAIVPKLTEKLTALAPNRFRKGDVDVTADLLAAWQLIGAGALARGDTARAERYLAAAWQAGFLPEAGWQLGVLRERQKRSAEAAALWMATKTIPAWWHRPADFEGRLAAIGQAVPFERGADLLMKLRTVTFPGTPAEDFTEEVLLLVGSNGRIEGMKDLTKKNEAAFDRLVPRLGTARMSLSSPDEHPVKLVRRGVLACYHLTNCSVVFDLPGTKSFVGGEK